MDTKALLYGIIGFLVGGFVVSVAAVAFDDTATDDQPMSEMTRMLETKTGDAYDEAFIANMIAHHQSAVDMARLSEKRAKHQEIIDLSRDIIQAQQAEIDQMKTWQEQWGYEQNNTHMHR